MPAEFCGGCLVNDLLLQCQCGEGTLLGMPRKYGSYFILFEKDG